MKAKHPILARWAVTLALPLLIWWEFPGRIMGEPASFFWEKWYPDFWDASPEYCMIAWSLAVLALLVWILKPRFWSGLLLYILVNAPWSLTASGYVTGIRISNIQLVH